MKKAIGFRAKCDSIVWVVVSSNDDISEILENDYGVINRPKSYKNTEEAFAYLRSRVLALLQNYAPISAGVRYPETIGKTTRLSSMYERCRLEGVIVTAIMEQNVPLVFGGLTMLGNKLGESKVKPLLDATSTNIHGVSFRTKSIEHKEAVLAAVAALEAQNGN